MTETCYCTNPNCTASWIVPLENEQFEVRTPKFCEPCLNSGYTISPSEFNWNWDLLKDGEVIGICTSCYVDENPEVFPHDHMYMCANKDCDHSWVVHLTEPNEPDHKLCSNCINSGFKISVNTCNDKFCLYRYNVKVAVYSCDEAYQLNKETPIKEPME
jgi:hypothetical protein